MTQKQIISVLFFLLAVALFAQPYNGTAVGSLSYATAVHGQGIVGQDNAGIYFTTPAGATSFPGDFTVGFKFITTGRDGYRGLFNTGNLSCQVYGYTGHVYCVLLGVSFNTSAGDIADGSAHSVAVSRVGTAATIWIDGVSRATATVGTGNLGGGSAANWTVDGGTAFPSWAKMDEIYISTSGTPTTCSPCVGSEPNLRALYHLDGNLTDSAVSGPPPLVAGILSGAVGLDLTAATGGTSPYSYQLQSYTGACASGTFANDGAALTGQTSTALFARTGATVRCFRVVVTDAASATANSNSVTAPTAGGGMRSY